MIFSSRLLRLSIVLLLGCASGILFGGALAMKPAHERMRQYSFGGVIQRLEDATITSGTSWVEADLPKPFADVGRRDSKGRIFGLNVFKDETQVLLIYMCDARVHSACLITGVKSYEEKWYFFDEHLLQEHILLSRQAWNKTLPVREAERTLEKTTSNHDETIAP